MNIATQVWITLFGGTAIFLLGSKSERVRRWGFVCGLLSQPAWYYQMVHHGQWAMLPVYTFYTFSWLRGFYNNFLNRGATS